MKESIFTALYVLALVVTISACTNSTPKSSVIESKTTDHAIYTCTMHPEVRKDKPGDCPICGMDLVKMDISDSTSYMHNHSDTMHMN